MIPYTAEEYRHRVLVYGTAFILTRWKDSKIESFLLEPEKVLLKELQYDKDDLSHPTPPSL